MVTKQLFIIHLCKLFISLSTDENKQNRFPSRKCLIKKKKEKISQYVRRFVGRFRVQLKDEDDFLSFPNEPINDLVFLLRFLTVFLCLFLSVVVTMPEYEKIAITVLLPSVNFLLFFVLLHQC